MIPNQRHLFDLPDDVAYLNIAYTAPLLHAAAKAGRDAIQAKQNPWTIASNDFFSSVETVRSLFAGIVGCNSDCVAIIPAVSYGIALAAKNLPIEKDQSIVVLLKCIQLAQPGIPEKCRRENSPATGGQ
jgi:kynureninase